EIPSVQSILHKKWLFNAIVIGISFIILFYLIALTAQKITISVATISNKMSMVIPILSGILIFGETLTIWKMTGILLAVAGVYFASLKEGALSVDRKYIYLPFLVFTGNGLIEAFLKFTQANALSIEELDLFLAVLFLVAFVSGILYNVSFFNNINHVVRSMIWGIILGFPNYGSIYFLMKTLEYSNLESSVVFPVNNISIVVLSSLLSYFFFKEHFNIKNKLGIAFSISAIILIVIS
ncbi:MAG: EamA/RhaT family transporter, partial [Bacteroidetes bacterium]